MPWCKTAPSLKVTCLRHIAHKFNYWAKEYVHEYVDQGDVPLYVVGPFDEWTSELTQELLDTLVKEKLAKSYQLHLLLHLRLESLDLSDWSQIVQDNIANIIAHRCNRLKTLLLTNCKRIKPQKLADIVRALPKLKKLDLSGTRVTDQVLAVLGHSCPHLLDLSLKGTAISDGGLACLTHNPTNGNPGCRFLKRLDLSCIPMQGHCKSWGSIVVGKMTSLSYHGLLALVNYCKNLEVLDSEDTFGVMKLSEVEQPSERVCSSIKRLKVHINEGESKISDIPTLFPHLIELCIEGVYHHQDLKLLDKLDSLKKLSLHSDMRSFDEYVPESDDLGLLFDEGIHPLLQCIGHQLTCLSLHYISSVNLSVIGRFCTHLHSLSVEFTDNLVVNEMQITHDMFVLLKSFECIHTNHDSCLSESSIYALTTLLSLACSLNRLRLVCLLGVNDDHFGMIYAHNTFNKLQTVQFVSCDDITSKTIDRLVYCENDLVKLNIVNCRHIWTSDTWVKFCDTENRELEIDFAAPPFLF